MINRSTQVQAPTGLTDTKPERRYQMSDQLTLKGWFQNFFDNVFQCPVLRLMSSKHLFETPVLVLKILYLFLISEASIPPYLDFQL